MKLQKFRKIVPVFMGFAFLCIFLYTVRPYSKEGGFPGSNEDPLITKSYLERRLSFLGKGQGGSVRNVEEAFFQKVYLRKNSSLSLGEGASFIVYRGSGKIKGRSGLINVSKGVLFVEGNSIVKYNLFLAPEEGSRILAGDNMTVFVSGDYQINN